MKNDKHTWREGVLVLCAGLALMAHCSAASADDEYYYIEGSLGHFFNGYYRGAEPDGKIPARAAIGRAWERGDWTYFTELSHRSNLDLGTPIGSASEAEYTREGVFAGFRYKWRN